MSRDRPYSLRRRLFWQLLAVQGVVLVLVVGVLFGSGQLFDFESTENTVEILKMAIQPDQQGEFSLRDTKEMKTFRDTVPDRWFVIRDGKGHQLSEGTVPTEYAALGNTLDQVGQARFGWNVGDGDRPVARMRWVETKAGRLQILTGSPASAPLYLVLLGVSLVLLKLVLPILGILALGACVATPLVVRRVMAGMERAAAQADSIDIEQRGVRLASAGMPTEVAPFVRAVNGALGRLDDGYDLQELFLADAAHELRTPIAILKTRIASLPQSSVKSHLTEDVARMAVLTEQMLDLQRLKQGIDHFSDLDLVPLTQRVMLDIGPLAFSAGYEVAFEAKTHSTLVNGDPVAIERALTNLVQNAIDHGGRTGIISVTVWPKSIEINDQGEGVPVELRERIFEPFFKRHHGAGGAGLGLKLVREIMGLHGGTVVIAEKSSGGCFKMIFP
ncbi:HAMP domain-containing histidine kinase (plasmid) [Phyllobacterium sp. 628]|uniref:sensor histidine kinase n=1 Tax=Phyllobacterium sp. 628 TaxID=2718938 RepID=UPI0016626901|nr:HAMP domain-containing sensor histidine kinase [Phyllobacterium sp. 628]QND55108.1 HAMP domain-containing histidine kinase [Phyllobacterium sp. 628]